MASPWFYFNLLASIFINSSSSHVVPYTIHCSSIVPESTTTTPSNKIPLPYLSTSYFTGGNSLLPPEPSPNQTYLYLSKSIGLRLVPEYFETVTAGTYKVAGNLLVRFPQRYYDDTAGGSIRFSLSGFWSEESRKLCMVGSGMYHGDGAGGKRLFDAVLKLKFEGANNPQIYASVVSGILESTTLGDELDYFDPISIFSFPVLPNYNYLNEVTGVESEVSRNLPISLEPNWFCSVSRGFWELEYSKKCREDDHNCSPIGSSLPPILHLTPIECSENERRLRYIATFQDLGYGYHALDPDSSVIGESFWDDKSNQVIGTACRLVSPLSRFGDAVEDCTMRLRWRYPSILTIVDDTGIVGQIWSSKPVNDSGYFGKIDLKSTDKNDVHPLTGAGYEYTVMDRVRKSCERKEKKKKKKKKKKGNAYPGAHSYSMKFDMSVRNERGESVAWGYAVPVFVGNESYTQNNLLLAVDSTAFAPESAEIESISEPENTVDTSSVNITYRITINPLAHSNWSMNPHHQVEMNAEGVYDVETGSLCMVGCKKTRWPYQTVSKDCEILIKFQFASFNTIGGLIKGTIESTRPKTDPLHFAPLITESAAYYGEEAQRTILRMDLEVALVLISNIHSCIFTGLQILHIKMNPEAPPFISMIMLVILSLGDIVPLLSILFLPNFGGIEEKEAAVSVITMASLLLQLRLIQLVWTAKKPALVSVATCIAGGLVILLLEKIASVWGDLRHYAGLVADGFLVPQIWLNIVKGSEEKALCEAFYMGTSAVRVVPHAYHLYRMHNYPTFDVKGTYYFGNSVADLYYTAWDITVCCGIIGLAVVVFMQQRHAGLEADSEE